MKLNLNQELWQINKDNIGIISDTYEKYNIPYFKEIDDDNKDFIHYYATKDVFSIERKNFNELLYKLNILNNSILKKAVFHIMTKDINALSQMKMSKKMIEVMKYSFSKLNISWYGELPLSYFWRYDLLLDNDNNVKIVEINSETPAWLPESFTISEWITPNIELFTKSNLYSDPNMCIEWELSKSLNKLYDKIGKECENKTISVIYWTEETENFKIDETFEDNVNMYFMTDSLKYNIDTKWINADVRMTPAQNVKVKDDWLYIYNSNLEEFKKADYIWTFYPMEWFFTDKWWDEFWDLYMNWKFDIINSPLNLITQNKAFWAYIWQEIEKWTDIFDEIELWIYKELIPHSVFDYKEGYIKKPLYYREWVWIGDDSYVGDAVYQEMINQKKFVLDTFYGNGRNAFEKNSVEWYREWYLTLWIYYWENRFWTKTDLKNENTYEHPIYDWFIGIYNRFCENFVTDDSSYITPVYIKEI